MVAVPVMIGVSMLPKSLARRLCLAGAGFFTILLAAVPVMALFLFLQRYIVSGLTAGGVKG